MGDRRKKKKGEGKEGGGEASRQRKVMSGPRIEVPGEESKKV